MSRRGPIQGGSPTRVVTATTWTGQRLGAPGSTSTTTRNERGPRSQIVKCSSIFDRKAKMKTRTLASCAALLIAPILVAIESPGALPIPAQRNRQQKQRPNREGPTQTQPRRTTGQPIAYADIDFDNQLVLPKGVGNAGDDAIEHEIHERAPGGPSRGGAGEGASETDRPRGPSLTLPAATLFGAQTKLGDDPMIAVSEN